MVTTQRKRIRLIVAAIAVLFFGFLFLDAMGVFKSEPYTAVPHGGHAHYMPDVRDAGIDASMCPSRAPGPDEFISPQCQMIRRVQEGGTTYYVPDNAQEGAPLAQFPTRPPASGEVIAPTGQIVTR